MQEIVRYEDHNLGDLSGTFDDIGSGIANISRATNELTPLLKNINRLLENPVQIVDDFVSDNPMLVAGLVAGASLLGIYFGSGIIRNGIEIYRGIKK